MRDGIVMQAGPPQEIYDRPDNVFVADFMGFRNFFPGEVGFSGADGQAEVASGALRIRGRPRRALSAGEAATPQSARRTCRSAARPDFQAPDNVLGRMSISKQFHGDLEATSTGQMLTAGTSVKDSAGYVAVERVTGSLNGRAGSFILQHTGVMTRGAPDLTITVVPDSGSDQLAGLVGRMSILIADGKHSYVFDYTLP